MRRNFPRAVILAAVLAALFVALRYQESEPSYQGVTVSRWLRLAKKEELEKVLAKIGPKAVPYLTNALRKEETWVSRFQAWVWLKLPSSLQPKLSHYRPGAALRIRDKARTGLRGLGPEAKAALPALIAMASLTNDGENDAQALWRVTEVGGHDLAAKELVLAWLRHPDRTVRSRAAGRIYVSRLPLPEAVPLMVPDLGDRSEKPFNELLALSVQGPDGVGAVPLIAAQMNDPQIHGHALRALKGIGAGLKPAVPALVKVLREGNPELMPVLAEVFMKAGRDAHPALPDLEELQRKSDPLLRLMAHLAIAYIEEERASSVPLLLAELNNRSAAVRMHWKPEFEDPALRSLALNHRETAAWFLGEMGPAALVAAPALENALEGNEAWLSILAGHALYKITGRSEDVLPHLTKALNWPGLQSFLAVFVLGELGADARAAVPRLLETRTRDLDLRRAVNRALNRIEVAPKPKAGGNHNQLPGVASSFRTADPFPLQTSRSVMIFAVNR